MSTGTRVATYVAGLAVVLTAALGLGRLVGPRDAEPVAHDDVGHGDHPGSAPAAEKPGGLLVSQDGYTLDLVDETVAPGRKRVVRFRIVGPDGAPVTAYDVEHEKELHLIALRRDLAGFQHVHPTMAEDGTWTAHLALHPGTWRIYADIVPTDGPDLTLGADLQVSGEFTAAPRTRPTATAQVDGYEVHLSGDLVAGEATTLSLHVERDGRPVTDLQPYLGAYGHLVAIREGDLAYLHVHPEEGPAGPEIEFGTTLPTPGRYRLFLDFKHDDTVRTAAFTVATTGASDEVSTPFDRPDTTQEGGGHDH
jgi:hypothetical protein